MVVKRTKPKYNLNKQELKKISDSCFEKHENFEEIKKTFNALAKM
ncbi:MAG: hypothetical protein ACRDAW_02450 [Metamycoplasmataceae bacterium]